MLSHLFCHGMLAHLLAHAVRIETSWHASARARNMIATSDRACDQMHAIMFTTMMLIKIHLDVDNNHGHFNQSGRRESLSLAAIELSWRWLPPCALTALADKICMPQLQWMVVTLFTFDNSVAFNE